MLAFSSGDLDLLPEPKGYVKHLQDEGERVLENVLNSLK